MCIRDRCIFVWSYVLSDLCRICRYVGWQKVIHRANKVWYMVYPRSFNSNWSVFSVALAILHVTWIKVIVFLFFPLSVSFRAVFFSVHRVKTSSSYLYTLWCCLESVILFVVDRVNNKIVVKNLWTVCFHISYLSTNRQYLLKKVRFYKCADI